MRTIGVGFITLLCLGLVACDWEEFEGAGSARYKEDFHYSYPLKPGGRISIENFNGGVEITGWEKDEVEINGTRSASSEDLLRALKVDIVPSPDAVRIRTIRPSDRRGNMGVRYSIRAPRKVVLERIESTNGAIRVEALEGGGRLRTTNGAIRALRFLGDLEANTTNGSVEVQEFQGAAIVKTTNGSIRADGVRGGFEASTSNGGVKARVLELQGNRRVRVETTNGGVALTIEKLNGNDVHASTTNSSIELRLPSSVAARVRATTTNSTVTSDFDVNTREGRISKGHMEGSIGSGGSLVDLNTTNGTIRILKM